MLLDQETLRFVFGLKLRGLRLERGFSLKDLSKRTGLSPSYLNEIEKGKKYPKTEKILLLAEALGERHEDLISLEFRKDLQFLQALLDKKLFTGIPYDIFGIPAATVFELVAERPKKIFALIGTLLEIARAHNIQVDDFLFALLRSYLDMHQNYFPSLEESARKFRQAHPGLENERDPAALKKALIARLRGDFRVETVEADFAALSPDLQDLLSFVSDQGERLYVAQGLNDREKILILAREIGFRFLKLKTRPASSLLAQLDSFEPLYHHFSASYFASALLIPEERLRDDLQVLLGRKQWDPAAFQALIEKHPCPAESVFHRLTQLLPKHFDLKQLFFLRYEYDPRRGTYEIARELHLSGLSGPHRVKGPEHYCARWLIHRQTQARLKGEPAALGVQRSRYAGTESEYLVIATTFDKPASQGTVTSVCLGLLMNEELKARVPWVESADVPKVVVGSTCERCPQADCTDRQVAMDRRLDPNYHQRVFDALKAVR